MTSKPLYLSKSRFKLGFDCPAKLFYTGKKNIYPNQSIDDPFLQALANGGFQVGEMAKFLFCDDPYEEDITINILGYKESFSETQLRIKAGKQIIAEAAFQARDFFIRTDIINFDEKNKTIKIFEVKAKSFGNDDSFFKKKDGAGLLKDSLGYLIDVAFQKYVVSLCYPGYSVLAYMIFADKDKQSTIEGLNQMFRILRSGDRYKIEIKRGLKKSDLGDIPLRIINVNEEVDFIWNNPLENLTGQQMGFLEFVNFLSEAYKNDKKIDIPVHSGCKSCEFHATKEEEANGLKSGFKECWTNMAEFKPEDFDKPSVLEMWNFRKKDEMILEKKYFIDCISEDDIKPSKENGKSGLLPSERQLLQIKKVKEKDNNPELLKEELKAEMDSWVWPLHFIDFETSAPALPFNKGRKPYEGLAFQFSHHQVDKNGKTYKIEHKDQYLSFEAGKFPNYDFVKALKDSLNKDAGSVFMYHHHENSYLNFIFGQLSKDNDYKNKQDLIDFIQEITCSSKSQAFQWTGKRKMIDMLVMVKRYFYMPQTHGSNSLKQVLPGVINVSDFIKDKYSKDIYGKNKEIPSLNYDSKIWIDEKYGMDPYKSLEPVFYNYSNEELDQLVAGDDDIKDGGAAMTAYCTLQFSHIPEKEREQIKNALFRYCELDTLAMVLLWEYWNHEIYK